MAKVLRWLEEIHDNTVEIELAFETLETALDTAKEQLSDLQEQKADLQALLKQNAAIVGKAKAREVKLRLALEFYAKHTNVFGDRARAALGVDDG